GRIVLGNGGRLGGRLGALRPRIGHRFARRRGQWQQHQTEGGGGQGDRGVPAGDLRTGAQPNDVADGHDRDGGAGDSEAARRPHGRQNALGVRQRGGHGDARGKQGRDEQADEETDGSYGANAVPHDSPRSSTQ